MFNVIFSITWVVLMLTNLIFSLVSNNFFRKSLNIYQQLNLKLGSDKTLCTWAQFVCWVLLKSPAECMEISVRVSVRSLSFTTPDHQTIQYLSSVLSLNSGEPAGCWVWEWQTNKKQ